VASSVAIVVFLIVIVSCLLLGMNLKSSSNSRSSSSNSGMTSLSFEVHRCASLVNVVTSPWNMPSFQSMFGLNAARNGIPKSIELLPISIIKNNSGTV